MRFFALVVLLTLSGVTPGVAQARSDCPVASDLRKGIRLTRQSPYFDMALQKKDRIVSESRNMVRDGKRRRIKTTYLQGLLPLHRQEGTQTISLELENKRTDFVTKSRIKKWSSSIKIRIGQKQVGSGKVVVRQIGQATWSGHGCKYKVKRVVVSTLVDGRPPSHFEYYYSLELGVSLGGYRLASDGRTRINSVLPEMIAVR